jgi:phytoene synthase
MILPDTLERAKSITRMFGRGFYRASYLFPRDIREATWVLYAFVRIPDEMVDSEPDANKAATSLKKWITDWHTVKETRDTTDKDTLLLAAKELHERYAIPHHYSDAFLFAMQQDLTITRYETYADLEAYMYGSASVVGIMMSYIIGYRPGALPYAQALGEAFQLINFLRDAKDDYDTRGRIYIPREDMDRFGVSESDIAHGIHSVAWENLMKYEIVRARTLLAKGIEGIAYLYPVGQRAVYAASLIYGAILDEMEKNNFNTFAGRITISRFKKTMLLCKAVWNKNQ